jgi:hypothetical protein
VLRATRDRAGSPHQESRIPPSPSGARQDQTLIIVDYADLWPYTDLIRLMQNPGISIGDTRVLLLARSVRWWPMFVHELHGTLVMPAIAALLELPDLDAAVMEAIISQLPGDRLIDYVDAAAELARRLAEMLRREEDPHRRANIHHMLGVRLLHAGKYNGARTSGVERG